MGEDASLKYKMEDREQWYGHAAEYWKKVDPSVNGMLQGFESISDIDAKGSKDFLDTLKKESILKSKCRKAADCGAGIGRVSKHFLLKEFELVDIVEQCEEFTNKIHDYLDDESLSSRVEEIYNEGLQTFIPRTQHYDVIWIQWVVGHLTDDDFVLFLKRCKNGLAPGGCIVIKDNVAGQSPVYDEEDSSVSRTAKEFLSIFSAAKLKVRKMRKQEGFPSSLFKVNMYALT